MSTASSAEPVGRLLSLNVGLPADVRWRDRTVHTGIWKVPVQGPRRARTVNIDGDGQGDLGGHGGPHRAVLVYQAEAYRYWSSELARDDLTPGSFGENFTVDGLPDDQVCIGDRYALGSAVFEVSAPRVTCYRLGLRLSEPRLPALVVAHHRPGFYLRVLQEGDVAAGDDIVRVARGPEQMTVADIDALLYLPGHQPDQLERALRIGALSPGWVGSFRAMTAQDGQPAGSGNPGLTDAATAPPPAWPGFRRLLVSARHPETATVVSVRLAAQDATPLPAGLPGQYVTLRLPGGDGAPVARSYSLSGRPGDPGYRVSVKREPHGRASALVHHLVAGGAVDVAAPRGGFTLDPGGGPVLLLSAGIGVTPVLAMLHALADTRSPRPVWWVHAARNSAEHAFRAETAGLLARLPETAREVICYTAPLPHDRTPSDYTQRGRPDQALIASLGLPADTRAYLCGPPAFVTDLRTALEAEGLAAAHVKAELFSPGPGLTPGIAAAASRAPHPPEGPAGPGPSVSFARSGLTVPWDPRHSSLLELAEACDVPVRWSCRTGVCHTCEIGLADGTVRYDPEPIDPPAAGNLLTCCTVPVDEVTVDL
jgi:ferredoxin-NADP reductase/MOSC domain-containing protein YiiM